MTRSNANEPQLYNPKVLKPVLKALAFPLTAAAISAFCVAQATWLSHRLSVSIACVLGYVTFQFGRAFITLLVCPAFPREQYDGEADIAPDDTDWERLGRRLGRVAATLGAGTGLGLMAFGLIYPWIGLPGLGVFSGVLLQWRLCGMKMGVSRTIDLEAEIRGTYVLYLRSFQKSRFWVVLAIALAVTPDRVLAILSPRRVESRSLPWYLLAVMAPRVFARLVFWSTSDLQWHRVASSCMRTSRAVVIDCAGPVLSAPKPQNSGLELEIFISLAVGDEHPVAYVVDPNQTVQRFPAPAVLRTGSSLLWIIRHFRKVTNRLRAVLRRDLSERELEFLRNFYKNFLDEWKQAMVRDRNLAAREGREDPHDALMSRDPLTRALEKRPPPDLAK